MCALGATGACLRSEANKVSGKVARPRVALVMKSLANEFFQTMEQGARAHERASGGRYELRADGIKDEQDVARQIDLVEQMLATGARALVIAPADSKALVTVVARAVKDGVVVVNIDSRLDRPALQERGVTVPFVGPDNRGGARMAGEALARTLPLGAEVAILEGAPGAQNGIERGQGFVDAMKATGMTIVAQQSGFWEMEPANRVASALLAAHPKLAAFLAANDSMALGAIAALKAAGKLGQVKVVGFDNITAVRDLVKSGSVLATVDQHADRIAVRGIELALELLEGKATAADRATEVTLVTAEAL